MTFGQPTTLPAILNALEARVASALSLPADYVFSSLDLGDMADQGAPADQFVTLISPRGRVEQPDVAGGGPDMLAVDLTLTVEYWLRVEVDEGYRDAAALKDAALGILAKWRLLLKRDVGLQLYAPTATSGGQQSILKEPMRLIDFDLRPRSAKAGWVKLVSRWEVKYLEDTTT